MVHQFDVIIERDEESDYMTSPESTLNKIAARLPSPCGRRAGDEGVRYADISGFHKSATLNDIRKHGHVLTPDRYCGAEAVTKQNLANLGYGMEETP